MSGAACGPARLPVTSTVSQSESDSEDSDDRHSVIFVHDRDADGQEPERQPVVSVSERAHRFSNGAPSPAKASIIVKNDSEPMSQFAANPTFNKPQPPMFHGAAPPSSNAPALANPIERLKASAADSQSLSSTLNNSQLSAVSSRTGADSYVGFANLPNQVYRKAVRRGFDFSIMVVGRSGLGKSTLLNSLFATEIYNDEHPGPSLRPDKTLKIDCNRVQFKEGPVTLRLNVIDTPGFGDSIDNSNSWQPIIDFVDDRFERYLSGESMVKRPFSIPDERVHCCLYFLAPSGHGLTPIDIEFMKKLHDRVNIIPVIGKADAMTTEECYKMKRQVLSEIAKHGINIYDFPNAANEEPDRSKPAQRPLKEQNETASSVQPSKLKPAPVPLKERLPFAVVGSNKIIDVNGRRVRARQYPWGVVEVDNPEHSDFLLLRHQLITVHLQHLIDMTNNVHYEEFRMRKLGTGSLDPAKQKRLSSAGVPGDSESSYDEDSPFSQLEKDSREHELKLKRMEAEMEQVFELKVKEKESKLRQSEQELQNRREQMDQQLTKMRREQDELNTQLRKEMDEYESNPEWIKMFGNEHEKKKGKAKLW